MSATRVVVRVTVYMYTHLQSVPSAACTICDLLCLPTVSVCRHTDNSI